MRESDPGRPLLDVLADLPAIGIPAGVREYRALRLALAAEGTWTLERLEHVLASLLAKNEDEHRRLHAHLERVFAETRKVEPEVAGWGKAQRRAAYDRVRATLAAERSEATSGARDSPAGAAPAAPGRAKLADAEDGPAGLVGSKPGAERWRQHPALWTTLAIGLALLTVLPLLFVDGGDDGGTGSGATFSWGRALPLFGSLLLALPLLAFLPWLRRRLARRRPQAAEPPTRLALDRRQRIERGPAWFRAETVGAHLPEARVLSRRLLDRGARRIPFTATELPSAALAVERTVAATAANGGLAVLVFAAQRAVRGVTVLVDESSPARLVNTVAEELTAGLRRRGLEARYGRFRGTLEGVWLEQHWRPGRALVGGGDVIMFVSDGRGLAGPAREGAAAARRDESLHLLRELARGRRCAWLDLRERAWWRLEREPHLQIPRLPVLEASPEGVETAVSLIAAGMARRLPEQPAVRRRLPAASADDPARHVREVLGSALAWGEACAMVQPVGVPLAQALRARFALSVAPNAIERLTLLEGTQVTQSGLLFATPVLAELRRLFPIHHPPEEQARVLDFIAAQIDAAEPSEKGSLAHDLWRWHRARFLLDADLDRGVEEVLALAREPHMRARIRDSLRLTALSGSASSGEATLVPLRDLPRARLDALVALMQELDLPLAGQGFAYWQTARDRSDTLAFGATVEAVALAADGRRLVAWVPPSRPEILVYDDWESFGAGPTTLLRLETGVTTSLQLGLSADGAHVAVGLPDQRGGIRLFHVPRGQNGTVDPLPLPEPLLEGAASGFRSMSFAPTGSLFACGFAAESNWLVQLREGKIARMVQFRRWQVARALEFDPSGELLALAAHGVIELFEIARMLSDEGGELAPARVVRLEEDQATAIALGERGERLAVAYGEHGRVVDGRTGSSLLAIPGGGRILTLSLEEEGRTLFVHREGSRRTLEIYDVATGVQTFLGRAVDERAHRWEADMPPVAAIARGTQVVLTYEDPERTRLGVWVLQIKRPMAPAEPEPTAA
jgi:hypothetical protein